MSIRAFAGARTGDAVEDVAGVPAGQIYVAVAAHTPTPIGDIAPHVPQGLRTILMTAIDPDPSKRYPTPAFATAAEPSPIVPGPALPPARATPRALSARGPASTTTNSVPCPPAPAAVTNSDLNTPHRAAESTSGRSSHPPSLQAARSHVSPR